MGRDCVGIIIYEMGGQTKAKARLPQSHIGTEEGQGAVTAVAPTGSAYRAPSNAKDGRRALWYQRYESAIPPAAA
jgi:hypothetical protein